MAGAGRVLPIVAACDPVNLCYLHQAPIGQEGTVDTHTYIVDNYDAALSTIQEVEYEDMKIPNVFLANRMSAPGRFGRAIVRLTLRKNINARRAVLLWRRNTRRHGGFTFSLH